MADDNVNCDPVTVLSNGVLKLHQPMISRASDELAELLNKQEAVMSQLSKQRESIDNASKRTLFGEMVLQTKVYQSKLASIQKGIGDLQERSQKIKKRAVKLQQQKQHEALLKEQAKEWEIEREKQLVARPANRKA